MPPKRRDFRKRTRPGGGPWSLVRFILWLMALALLSFVVGALVISRLLLPPAPSADTNQRPGPAETDRQAPAPTLPPAAPTGATAGDRTDGDTIVEQAPTTSAPPAHRSTGADTRPSPPARSTDGPSADDNSASSRDEGDRPRGSDDRPRRRTLRDEGSSGTSVDAPRRRRGSERQDARPSSEHGHDRRSADAGAAGGNRRQDRSDPPVRRASPPSRPTPRTERRTSPPPADRPERRNGGVQRGETIGD
jgi:hypothetical protein